MPEAGRLVLCMRKKLPLRTLVTLVLVLVAWQTLTSTVMDVSDGAAVLATAWKEGTSGVWVEGTGSVVRILSDDQEGSLHQRFVVSVSEGHTVLISHNIDLAQRVDPLDVGDRIEFRGRYEWNEQGGVVHWTHHDPEGRLPGGWIDSRGGRVR